MLPANFDRRLFRLAMKLFGAYLVTTRGDNIIFIAINSLRFSGRLAAAFELSETYILFLYVALGLYLLFGGKRLLDLAFPLDSHLCIRCGYDLTGAPGPRCPECGLTFLLGAAIEPVDKRP